MTIPLAIIASVDKKGNGIFLALFYLFFGGIKWLVIVKLVQTW